MLYAVAQGIQWRHSLYVSSKLESVDLEFVGHFSIGSSVLELNWRIFVGILDVTWVTDHDFLVFFVLRLSVAELYAFWVPKWTLPIFCGKPFCLRPWANGASFKTYRWGNQKFLYPVTLDSVTRKGYALSNVRSGSSVWRYHLIYLTFAAGLLISSLYRACVSVWSLSRVYLFQTRRRQLLLWCRTRIIIAYCFEK